MVRRVSVAEAKSRSSELLARTAYAGEDPAFRWRGREAYGRLRAGLERSRRPLPDADLMIAAIGLARGLVVVTGNVRHFARVEGLKFENWL